MKLHSEILAGVLSLILMSLFPRPLEAAPILASEPVNSCQFPYPGWKDDSPTNTGRVECILPAGNSVYVGGDVIAATDSAGRIVPRNALAVVDADSAQLLDFAPNFHGRVNALAISADGSTLLAGGEFTQLDGKPAPHLAAIDLTSHAVLNLFDRTPVTGIEKPATSPQKVNRFGRLPSRPATSVSSILTIGNDVYIGGDFNAVANKKRFGMAKLTLANGQYSLADWAPLAQKLDKDNQHSQPGRVKTLLWDETRNRIIVGGFFTAINNDTRAARLAAIDPDTGEVLMHFEHLPDSNGKKFPFSEVIAAAVDRDTLYVAMGGPGGTALAYNLNDGTLKWFYQTDGNVQAATVVGGYPIFGHHGDFLSTKKNTFIKELNKKSRLPNKKIFMLSPDGMLQTGTPVLDRLNEHLSPLGVFSLSSTPGRLYVGGDFTRVNQKEQQRFAIFQVSNDRPEGNAE